MSVIDNAIAWARRIAADNIHGYDQANRWGPDYDCSSFVISAFKAARRSRARFGLPASHLSPCRAH